MLLTLSNKWGLTIVRKIMDSVKTKIAVGQMTATNNIEHNLKQVKCIVDKGKQENAQIVFLPEACDYVAESKQEAIELAEPLTGRLVAQYKDLAKKHNVWLSFGGIHELTDNNKAYNTHILINNMGTIVAAYRKLHLFDVKIPEEKIFLVESNTVAAGKNIVPPVKTPIGNLGLCICYDMRFPELAIALRHQEADILTYPSAFTHATGAAHWEVLLRARAIESQCYVIAAAQIGPHNKKRISYGQAIVIDPWGKVIAECPKYDGQSTYEPTICTAEIELSKINEVRRKMPVIGHKRTDIYGNLSDNCVFEPIEKQAQYNFGGKTIPGETVFYNTALTYAFTNIRCVVPGHVLVATVRDAKRLTDLKPNEISDLFQTVIKVQRCVEKMYNASSSTVAIQDGEDAGQTVKHVHVHILPRIPGDFANNDDIYEKLAIHDKQSNPSPLRALEEQIKEANTLRKLI